MAAFRLTTLMLLLVATAATGDEPRRPNSPTRSVSLKPTSQAADQDAWPQWRGINRDGISLETDLLSEWPEGGPKLVWSNSGLGMGYSGPSVRDDRLFILGTADDKTACMGLDIKSNKILWTTPIGEIYVNGWGDGPRSTPTIDGDKVYALSGEGNLNCLSAVDGKVVWTKSLVEDFGGSIPKWGYSESPLVDGDVIYCTPGGTNFMVALDKKSGETIWKSTGFDTGAQYSSIIKATVGKVTMGLTMSKEGLVAINLEDGKYLWNFEKTANSVAVIPTPVFHDNYVYSTSGYGTGSGLVKVVPKGSTVEDEEVYFNKVMKNHHGGVVLWQGHIYGHSDKVGWICQDFLTGELVWRERNALSKGSIAYADGNLYCYGQEEGKCFLVEASPEGWKPRGNFEIPIKTSFDRKKGRIWTHPVIADGKLYLRDQEHLFCYDIRK
ncbi:outer membrane biogenesis protein BamB [Planctomycetes bacterium Pan216]|uniref:Outer membrane biogenesis protein BamB n=1 Tax=Kolteria novifilia TaxID=2527975 RepID=A0A518BA03_9BACT|nr:outer membrane biogenesis protein BamB [Planctomycetes bacterium Pan216]